MKPFISTFLLLITLTSYSQTEEKIQFIILETAIDDLKNSKRRFENKWEYSNLMYLDTSIIADVKAVYPSVAKKFIEYSMNYKGDSLFSIPKGKINDIKECFTNKEILNKIKISKIWNRGWRADMYYRVYLHKNMAIYELYGKSWSETNRITIKESEILIENLSNFVM